MKIISLVSFTLAAAFYLTLTSTKAQELPEVMGVFAPGQGAQSSETAAAPPSAFGSQREMFADLLSDIHQITDDKDLLKYYKPMSFEPLAEDDIASKVKPRPDVTIVRDKIHFVPRVYGDTREAAMFGAGYARAEDRLWQMDVNRHIWRARLIEILGRGENDENLKQDLIVAQRNDYDEDELLAMFHQLDETYGTWGKLVQEDLDAHVAGINAFIAKVNRDPALLPDEYRERNIKPGMWRVTDFIAEAAHVVMAYQRGYGKTLGLREVGNARILKQLQSKYGDERGWQVFEDVRNRNNPDAITVLDKPTITQVRRDNPKALALPDFDSFEPLDPIEGFIPFEATESRKSRGRSNALLVGGQHTVSGRPISVQGPQDGFSYPHFYNSEILISAPDLAAYGILEVHGPYPFNGGRGENFAVSMTSQHTDTADIFALKPCNNDRGKTLKTLTHYFYKSECIPFEQIVRKRTVFGDNEELTFRTLRSVYGPVIGRATVDGEPVVLTQARASWFHDMGSLVGFARLATPSATRNAKDLVAAVEFVQTGVSFYFITKDAIAHAEGSIVPQRADGVTGDFPLWGDGAWDWKGFDPETRMHDRIPYKDHPKIINPQSGIIAGWNSQIAPGWSIADSKWTFGPYHRKVFLERELGKILKTRKVSRTDIVRAHTLAQVVDTTWASLWPLLRPMIGHIDDPRLAEALALFDAWVEYGAYRADFDDDGYNEHGAAIHIADGWRASLSLAYYNTIFGKEIVSEVGRRNNLPRLFMQGGHNSPSTAASLWQNTLMNDLLFYLDQPRRGDLNYRYCGQGDKEQCRTFLIETLEQAIDARSKVLGSDFEQWKIPSTCTGACAEHPFAKTSPQINFTPTNKAPTLDPIPWQNRPTFEITATFGE